MCDVIEKYVCYVIFEKNEVGVLPRWASCPTLPYSMLVKRAPRGTLLHLFIRRDMISKVNYCVCNNHL